MTPEFLIAILKSVSGTIKTCGHDNSHLQFVWPSCESIEIISSRKSPICNLNGVVEMYYDDIVFVRKSTGEDSIFNFTITDFDEGDIEFDIFYILDRDPNDDYDDREKLDWMISFVMPKTDYLKLKLEHS